ncbi:MAG: amidohydrolase family protein [Singulisphaera sp.]
MTADGPVDQFYLSPRKWISHDVEMETGCGWSPSPTTTGTRSTRSGRSAWSGTSASTTPGGSPGTDHPTAARSWPTPDHRPADGPRPPPTCSPTPAKVRARSGLADLPREYSLAEIAIITRASPARMLGLTRKGHLGPGADGDVAIYRPDADKERMFSRPRYLIKAGQVVLDDGDLRSAPEGRSLHVARVRPGRGAEIEAWCRATSCSSPTAGRRIGHGPDGLAARREGKKAARRNRWEPAA